jgi:hypothetical protein
MQIKGMNPEGFWILCHKKAGVKEGLSAEVINHERLVCVIRMILIA